MTALGRRMRVADAHRRCGRRVTAVVESTVGADAEGDQR